MADRPGHTACVMDSALLHDTAMTGLMVVAICGSNRFQLEKPSLDSNALLCRPLCSIGGYIGERRLWPANLSGHSRFSTLELLGDLLACWVPCDRFG